MGNVVTCATSVVPANAAKVVKVGGGVQELRRRTKVAEVMLEHPQHFVCTAAGLQVGRRICALPADDDLELGHLYLVLPMSKRSGVLSANDMAAIGFWIKGGAVAVSAAGAKNAARILPEPEREKMMEPLTASVVGEKNLEMGGSLPKLSLDDVPDLAAALAQLRMGSCRHWRPRLETITESRPKLRDLMLSNEGFC